MTEAQIKHMVDRFLAWKLPEHFNPDGGISFERIANVATSWERVREPVGTNLLDATQADAMVRHMLEGLPQTAPDQSAIARIVSARMAPAGGEGVVGDEAMLNIAKLAGQHGIRYPTNAAMQAFLNCILSDYEREWKDKLDHADHLQRLFDQQWKRSREAGELWRQAHPGNDNVSPDLGELLTWLMSRAALSTATLAGGEGVVEAERDALAKALKDIRAYVEAANPIVGIAITGRIDAALDPYGTGGDRAALSTATPPVSARMADTPAPVTQVMGSEPIGYVYDINGPLPVFDKNAPTEDRWLAHADAPVAVYAAPIDHVGLLQRARDAVASYNATFKTSGGLQHLRELVDELDAAIAPPPTQRDTTPADTALSPASGEPT